MYKKDLLSRCFWDLIEDYISDFSCCRCKSADYYLHEPTDFQLFITFWRKIEVYEQRRRRKKRRRRETGKPEQSWFEFLHRLPVNRTTRWDWCSGGFVHTPQPHCCSCPHVDIYWCDRGKSNRSYRLLSQCVCLCVNSNTNIRAHTTQTKNSAHTHVCNQLSGNPEWINSGFN